MKIQRHFRFLIIANILLPVFCILIIPGYMYFSSSQHYLENGYKEIKEANKENLTDNYWKELKWHLNKVPPEVQILVIHKQKTVFSTFPEIKSGNDISIDELVKLIHETDSQYDYQLQTLKIRKDINNDSNSLIISRLDTNLNHHQIKNGERHKHSTRQTLNLIILILICFTVISLIVIIALSNATGSSIIFAEKTMRRIADGDIHSEIEAPRHYRNISELNSLIASMEKMRLSLMENESRRTKFIMGISHDLRTPVALIKGYAEAISDGVVCKPEKIKESTSIIITKASQLEDMINDLINYVKLNNSEWRNNLSEVELNPVLEDFSKGMSDTCQIYKRNIIINIQTDPGIKIQMDAKLFNRALENLFSNALRYTRDNDSIFFIAEQNEDFVRISIADTGIGIEEKDINHIFDLLYRGTNSRREGGMGIGLNVVKTIVDSHKWRIEFQSKAEQGSCFTIVIPLKEIPENNSLSQ